MPDPTEIDDRIDRASARPFGRRFHLRGRERATAELRGPQTGPDNIRDHQFHRVQRGGAPASTTEKGRRRHG